MPIVARATASGVSRYVGLASLPLSKRLHPDVTESLSAALLERDLFVMINIHRHDRSENLIIGVAPLACAAVSLAVPDPCGWTNPNWTGPKASLHNVSAGQQGR